MSKPIKLSEFNPVGDGTPLWCWLETYREGESATTISMCRILTVGDELEWIAKDGRSTVTHATYPPPTHWRWLKHDS